MEVSVLQAGVTQQYVLVLHTGEKYIVFVHVATAILCQVLEFLISVYLALTGLQLEEYV